MSSIRGRFSGPAGEDMARFSSSLEIDLRMLDEDVDGSVAHATVLAEAGILSETEARTLVEGLEAVRAEIREGRWRPDPSHEDVHMAVEARLVELVGEVGKKLHTARSRNDQVATDVRLWLKRRLPRLDEALAGLIGALLDRVDSDGRTLMPGYTHLQRGQPLWLGHHLLAHAWSLSRDRGRIADALRRLDLSPLGACALAGTPHPIDRRRAAELLGFAGVVENAMDAVSARDHVQETAAACAVCMTHLSRMAEELVTWSSTEFRFVRIPEAYATGSSIMPQKRNPDAAELVRGRAARVLGDAVSLLALLRGLPLAYNRDLQEERAPLFEAVEATTECVSIVTGVWKGLTVDRERFRGELRGDPLLATELADLLVTRGVPFREAHEAVGRLVLWCEENGRRLDGLTRDEARAFHNELDTDLSAWLDPEAAVERRASLGGTAWSEVLRQADLLKKSL